MSRVGQVSILVLSALLGVAAAPARAGDVLARFSGSGPQSTETFHVDGPWLLNWHAGSDFPTLAYIELHLYDANTGRLVGVAVRHTGVGAGERLIRKSGDFRISVVGTGIDWSLDIEKAPLAVDALLERNPDLTEVTLVPPDVGLDRDIVEHLKSWSTKDGRSLKIETDGGTEMSVGFYDDTVCPGLMEARNIFFVTSGSDDALFNAIMLENGTRCFFGGAVQLN